MSDPFSAGRKEGVTGKVIPFAVPASGAAGHPPSGTAPAAALATGTTAMPALGDGASSPPLVFDRFLAVIRRWLGSEAVQAFLFLLGAALLSRILLVAIGEIALVVLQRLPPSGIAELFVRWDSHWYVGLIDGGYSVSVPGGKPGVSNYAFSPLYPMLVVALKTATGLSTQVAGVLLSNLCFLAALALVHRYVRQLGLSETIARTTVLLLCFAPQGLVFSALYTESLFLLLAAGSLLLLRAEKPLAAGLVAALLGAVRPNGVFIIFFIIPFTFRRHGFRAFLPPWRKAEALLPLALAPLGLVLWWWYCFATTGDGFAQTTTEVQGWGWSFAFPFANMADFLINGTAETKIWSVVSIGMFLASFLLLRYRLYEEFVFCFSNFMLSWSGTVPYSLIRFSIVLFPIFIGIAIALRDRREATAILIGLSSGFSALMMVAWTMGNWLAT